MRPVEELNVLWYYKPFIEASGGVKQVRTALRWSEWYAVKWWEEVYSELGLQSIRESAFARALFISLRIRGYVREDGSIKKRPRKPEYPTNSYAMEFVDLHESFDRIGAVNVAANKADENTLAILYSTMLSQGWYKILRQTFLRLVKIERYPAIFEPIVKEGHTAAAVMEITTPKLYIGFDYRRDNVELASAMLRTRPGECGDRICIFQAPTACDAVTIAKRYAPSGVDAVLMLHTLYWLLDPVKELTCISQIIAPGGKLLVGQHVVESTPGLIAIEASFGAKHVFSRRGVVQILRSAGYQLSRLYLRYMPYYIAVWEPKRS
jgi:SAM-dependent methyltransferase